VDASISVDRIKQAAAVIDPIFLHSPQYDCEPLSRRLGVSTVLKVETANPIRSFKGRGTDFLLHQLVAPDRGFVCASAGNFGQGMAYGCRKRRIPLTVFASDKASPLKIERMRELGAQIELEVGDFEKAKEAGDYVLITESALAGQETVLAFKPRAEWPKGFRFLKLFS